MCASTSLQKADFQSVYMSQNCGSFYWFITSSSFFFLLTQVEKRALSLIKAVISAKIRKKNHLKRTSKKNAILRHVNRLFVLFNGFSLTKRFKKEHEKLRPSTYKNETSVELVKKIVHGDHWLTVRLISDALQLN